ncbi:hypothetical protein ACIA8K_06890 [Catenuloplanes sp. NPDC051500]|uniref:hypothetical protein n=1 Tax=Catenuloplanes sp. NPDC051500 TaxID=3363959 RepID=UPI0037B26C27
MPDTTPSSAPVAELIELDMRRPGHDRVLLNERTGDVVYLSADWRTTVDALNEGGDQR